MSTSFLESLDIVLMGFVGVSAALGSISKKLEPFLDLVLSETAMTARTRSHSRGSKRAIPVPRTFLR